MKTSKKNVADFYPLSPMQRGMLFHSLLAPDAGLYVELLSCTLRGELNVAAFRRAWEAVVEHNPILRTGFVGEKLKEPVQVVHRRVELPFAVEDWRRVAPDRRKARLQAYLDDQRRQGFDPARPPLLRLALLRTGPDTHTFVWAFHHALLDGWSLPLLLGQVFTAYEAARRDEPIRLPPARPYRDYIVWLARQDQDAAEAYWRNTLAGFAAPTPLVVDRPVPPDADAAPPAEQHRWLDRETTAALRDAAARRGLTLNTLVLGAWGNLLGRYSGEEDVLCGTTVSGRPPDLPGAETMVGLFINTLPVRMEIDDEQPLFAWLRELQERQLEQRRYEYTSLTDVQGWSDVPRGRPLFESLYVFENYPTGSAIAAGEGSLQIEDINSREQTNYPLNFIAGADERLQLKLLFDSQRFEEETISRMLGHLEQLLGGMLRQPEPRVGDLPLLTPAEREQLLVVWNDTAVERPLTPAHQLFSQQAARTPDAVAISFEGQQLTYAALERRANQIAHLLRHRGVGPEQIVGVCLERTPLAVVAILGVLKAGGAYLPLDPAYPAERLNYMLADAGVELLLTERHLAAELPGEASELLLLDHAGAALEEYPDTPVDDVTRPAHLAYVIYTSGSTGRPKGALLTHDGLSNAVHNFIEQFRLGPESRLLQFFSFSFDGSVCEIFPALAAGSTLCMAPQRRFQDLHELHQLFREERISTAIINPSTAALLPDGSLPDLHTLALGAEALPRELAERWRAGRELFNAYGPTEATVISTTYQLSDVVPERPIIPIGRPLPNVRLYVLDRRRRPVPIGVPGELYIGGPQVARGYLNRPELTAERFVPDPFSRSDGPRLYRTGDLVRYLPDGNLEFIGRTDTQIKLRGFRIELGEIEAALSAHPAVRAAVVDVRDDPRGEARLVAYAVADQESDSAAWRAFLLERLPAYMVPAAYVPLDQLPRLPNGKINRRALPEPEGTAAAPREHVPPRNELEMTLCHIWEEILDVRPVGVRDDFFALGGHSLLALRLVANVQNRVGHNLDLTTFFQGPTVEEMAAALRRPATDAAPALIPIQSRGDRPPLICIHPSGGSVHWYAPLAGHLDDSQPVYGLQARGLYGGAPLHRDIDTMADDYVKLIREFRPHGPYLLAGWSLGVIITYAVACRLRALGEPVSLVALLDQGPRVPGDEPEDDAGYLHEVFQGHLPLTAAELRALAPAEQIPHVYRLAREADWIAPDVSEAQFSHFVRILRTHTDAWRRFEPEPYPGLVTLFRAEQQPAGAPPTRDLGWSRLADHVEVVDVPGDHLAMIHEPLVADLAAALQSVLDRTRQPAGGTPWSR